MTVKRLLLGAGAALLVIGVAAILLDVPLIVEGYLRHESFFQGKPTAYWAQRLYNREEDYKLALKQLKRGGPAAVPVLVEALKDPEMLVREGAALALRELGPDGRAAVPALEEALADKDSRVRLEAAKTLIRIDPPATKAMPVLIESLNDANEKVRRQAVRDIKQIGEEAHQTGSLLMVESLSQALWLQDGRTRIEVTDLLCRPEAGGLRHPNVAPRLVLLLADTLRRDPQGNIREQAALRLGRIGSRARRAVRALTEAVQRDDQAKVRGWAIWALGQIGPSAKEAVPALRQATKDPDANIRTAATVALARIDPGAGTKPKTR